MTDSGTVTADHPAAVRCRHSLKNDRGGAIWVTSQKPEQRVAPGALTEKHEFIRGYAAHIPRVAVNRLRIIHHAVQREFPGGAAGFLRIVEDHIPPRRNEPGNLRQVKAHVPCTAVSVEHRALERFPILRQRLKPQSGDDRAIGPRCLEGFSLETELPMVPVPPAVSFKEKSFCYPIQKSSHTGSFFNAWSSHFLILHILKLRNRAILIT